jgi:hypothetical protein
MESRRDLLKTLAAGAAVAAVPTAIVAVESHEDERHVVRTPATGSGPWWLLAPLEPGFKLAAGWFVGALSPVVQGAAILTLVHESGRTERVHVCALHGSGRGVAQTALLDLVMMDGRTGGETTDEELGRVVLGLAKLIADNELLPNGDLRSLAWLKDHDERVDEFGPEALLTEEST